MRFVLFCLFFCLTACSSVPLSPVLNEEYDLWIFARYVVTNDGVLKNKYVGITRSGTIGNIANQKPHHETIINAGEHILAPGFINAHDHLSYDHRGPKGKISSPDSERYNHRRDWGGGCRGHKGAERLKPHVQNF